MSDIFVVMDNVQYQKNGMQNRNRIRNYQGDFWLTIPVTGHLSDLISNKKIAHDHWGQKHWKSITSSYAHAPCWKMYCSQLESLYGQVYSTLFEANTAFLDFMLRELDIDTRVIHLSDLDVEGSKSDLVLAICRKLGAKTYISGFGAQNYLDEKAFEDAAITIKYVNSVSPVYEQFHGAFIKDLSMLDVMFNVEKYQLRKVFTEKAHD